MPVAGKRNRYLFRKIILVHVPGGVFVVPGYFHSGFVAAGVAFRRKRIYRTALHIPVSAHARFACSSFRGLIENPFSFSKEVWLRVGYAGSRSCYGSVSGMLFAVIILYGMKRRGVGLTNRKRRHPAEFAGTILLPVQK